MNPLDLIIFDTDPRLVETFRRGIDLPFVKVVLGKGAEVTALEKLDALWGSWMMAERFGITPAPVPYRAEVFPNTGPFEGLPPFIVAGPSLASGDSFAPDRGLEINLDAMLEAVARFNLNSANPIRRLGTIRENLLLHMIEPNRVASTIEAAWRRHIGS
jgi:hypothetical protein